VNILFRCDGSEKIGMGHVVRCLALAAELQENHRCEIHFAMREGEIGFRQVKSHYPVLTPNIEADQFVYRDWLQSCIDAVQADVLILDARDGLDRRSLNQLKNQNKIRIVTIDDPEEKRMEADLAFFPPVPQLSDQNWDEFKGTLCIGWEYVFLRRIFLQEYPEPDNVIPNILVTMGGTDPYNLTQSVLQALGQVSLPFSVTVIIGPGYSRFEQLRDQISELDFECEIARDPENIAEVMAGADMAIAAFGQTAYELAALAVPALYINISEDHERSSGLFENSGLGINLGQKDHVKENLIAEKVTSLLMNHGELDTYRANAQGLGLKQSLVNISKLITD